MGTPKMNPERWARVKSVLDSAWGLSRKERDGYLSVACAEDPGLRLEVESLLRAKEKSPDSFMTTGEARSSLPHGAKLGTYEIIELIGAGGMGEVYRARDLQLRRDVAVKVLPPLFALEAERLCRFEQEARVAAALNHPNILAIYHLGRHDDQPYIVSELLQGQTLREELGRGALPTRKAIDFGLQIACGLTAAHEKGIVHRDLKPENLFTTKEGQLKILDFGLAKLRPLSLDHETRSSPDTEAGMIVGTLAYMPPEQLRGQAAEAWSDVWALGVVLYELLTGRLPFRGQTGFEISSAILQKPAQPLPPSLPVELRAVIERCLEKEPARRYQNGGELHVALETLQTGTTSVFAGMRYLLSRRRRLLTALALILMLSAAVVLSVGRLRIRSSGTQAIDSIAVLPFVNTSGNPEMEYLSDGITEILINTLSQVPNLAVMSRNSVFRYKGRAPDAQAIGQTLNVQTVLTGSVVQHGGGLSISAELIDVRNNRHLWGEQYNRKAVDILAVQDEISTEISEKLRLKLTGDEKKLLTKRYTENSEAYQLYLKGRYYWYKRTQDGFFKGIEYFQKAIEADSNYAPAYAGLAGSYDNLANYNFALVPPKVAWAKAKAAADKALQIDDTVADAHAALGIAAYFFAWDWPTAEKEFRRALELDPRSANSYHWYAHYLMTVGRTQESYAAGRRALELDPVDLPSNAHEGWYYLFTRQYDRAIEPLQKAIEMDPSFPVPQWYLGLAYEQTGAFENAISQFQNCVRITGGRPSMLALLGHAYALANRRKEAQEVLRQLSVLSKERYVPAYPVAAIYAALGQKDEAFKWLERAYDERDSWMDYLGLDPRLDGLRSDPRFINLLRRVALAPFDAAH